LATVYVAAKAATYKPPSCETDSKAATKPAKLRNRL